MIPSETERRSNEEVGRTDLRVNDSHQQQVVEARIKELHELGFSDDFIIDFPRETLVGANTSIEQRLEKLTSLGFQTPITLIEKEPSILSLTPESVSARIDNLTGLGFQNPIILIEKQPTILNLSPINISKKVKLFTHLVQIFNSPINPIKLMEQETGLFGTKIDKLIVLARISRNSMPGVSEIDRKLVHDILFANLEDVLLALDELGGQQDTSSPDYTIRQLVMKSKEMKARRIPKYDKRERIAASKSIDPKTQKRYFKGYPMKENA